MNYKDYKYVKKIEIKDIKDINENSKIKEDDKICRICYDNIDSKFINPCKCSGSIKWIHEFCLKKWIKISKKDCCTQCKYKYKSKDICKYPKLKFLNKDIYIKIITSIIILIVIIILSLISSKIFKNENNLNIFMNNKLFNDFSYFYNGLKSFLLLSFIILCSLHFKKKINILNIIYNNNLNIGTNIIELTYCIFIIYNELLKNIIKEILKLEKVYINYQNNEE